MANNKVYTEEDIVSLSPLEFTRLRPGVYCGSTEYPNQQLIEIVSNAIDEYKAGHGDKIIVKLLEDGSISVQDNGQGFIPNAKREDGKTVLEASFSVLNTSGKYTDDGVYEGTALGLNGIGAKLATYLSHWLEVSSWRDGKFESIRFVEGVFEKRNTDTIKDSNYVSGTYVRWMPSEEFFTNQHIEMTSIMKLFEVLACLCPGLTIELVNQDKTFTFHSKNGIDELVNKNVKDKEIINNRMKMNFANGKNKLDLVLTYTSNYSSTIVPYVNTGLTDSGPHITQIKTILTREMNKFFRDKNWLKEKDENLSGEDCQEGLYLAFNLTAPGVSYDAQTKSRIVKLDMKPFTQAIAEELQYWMVSNEKSMKLIADKAINARKAREAARKAREAARGVDKKKNDKVLKFVSKLSDCHGKDRNKCEIYITEGDSATGGIQLGRNNEFQAVLPVRGKILNCQKATLAQIQKNQEIMTMIDAFGLTIDPKTMKVTYHSDDLRYGKIIIASDADVDGSHIKNLFYTFIWNFCPELILDGYVYAAVPPLYKLTLSGNKGYKYIKDDAELEEYKKANPTIKFQLGRMKGLGEMDTDEAEETLLNPDQRIIKQITVEDVEAANKLFEDLMGTGVVARKEYIKAHSAEAEGSI